MRGRLTLSAQRRVVVLSVAAAVILLASCSSGGSKTAKANSGSGGTAITIKNFKFSPSPLLAKVGDTITVSNKDTTTHTATANDGSFNTHNIEPGSSATFTLNKAGKIAYHCNIHNYMTGVIQVTS